MLSTYLIIMGIVAGIITLAWTIGQIVKIVQTFREYGSRWEKFSSILNLLAILTVGVSLVILYITVAGLL